MKTISPINSGKILVEDCQSISATELLQEFKSQYKEIFLHYKKEVLGYDLEFTQTKPSFGGERIWFKCPQCGKRVEKLYKHPFDEILGCRSCLNLEYASRRYKGMIESAKPQRFKNLAKI